MAEPAPVAAERPPSLDAARSAAVAAMLDARSIALVGASARAGSFGARMVDEVARSTGPRQLHLVNPRYSEIGDRPCRRSLAEVDGPLDLVLLAVGDHALVEQLTLAAERGARAAVIFGSAVGADRRQHLREVAGNAGMAVCGAGCMGFVNVATGLRAVGYVERDPIPPGPVALVTHSGSVFSALLRTRRALGFGLAVSSGQELVTTTADYVDYALTDPRTRVIALVLETVREFGRLRSVLARAAAADVAVVVLPVGRTPVGAAMVAAHSGAVAGDDAMWEALVQASGMLRTRDLAELTDTVELLALARRPRGAVAPRTRPPGSGIATVHDSGAERTLTVDLAAELGVPFAEIGAPTRERLAPLLDAGLEAANPLDLWGTGADTRTLFAGCLRAMAADPAVTATVLAVDLVTEYDGDTAYADAVLDVAGLDAAGQDTQGPRPLAVLSHLASAVDQATAARLREAGVAVLEGTRSGLVALGHLHTMTGRDPGAARVVEPPVDEGRRDRWRRRLAGPGGPGGPAAVDGLALLADYGIGTVAGRAATTEAGAIAAADAIGYPVVLKTGDPAIPHKSDVGGVVLGLGDAAAVGAAYRGMADRLGRRVLVSATAPAGVELSIGLVRDAQLGPLVVLAAGGVLMELLADRVVACPPVSEALAGTLIDRLRIRPQLDGWRGAAPADVGALVRAVVGVSTLAAELGDVLDAVDVNPVIVGPAGAVAVDVLVVPRPGDHG